MNGSATDAKDIFLGALDCASPDDVARYLDVSCGDDAELRSRVEELLRANQQAGGFLGGDWAREQTPLDEAPGAVIGPYKLIEQIGEGGFGVVFRADQQRPVRRDVALKIIKLGMDTRQVVGRFEAERQALAMMDHPGIAKVFDAGSTDSGRPYFVMELVRGVPITEYCDRHHLAIDQRLDLFVQVCQAVQHAHQKGLIHRDIKPTNVLVGDQDARPVAKVIDFGIAKATQARLTEQTLFTDFRQLIGTPEYMSPEQAGGAPDVDTRSDVYSLGVLLYELLTGAPPFDPKELRSKAFAEVQRIIREVDPPKPSTRLSSLKDTLASVAARRAIEPRRLDSVIRGDLDWITMKALEKDRGRRYESAAALAADILHHLADEPVGAAAPSRAYRVSKFVQRNKLAVVATTAVLIALVAGVVGTTIGLIGQSRQRSEAEAAKDQLQAVNKFLTDDLLAAVEPSRLPDKAVRDEIVKAMIDPAAATVAERFAGKPLIEAAVRHALANAYEGLGRNDLALPHAREALAIRRRELGDDNPDTLESALELGTLLRATGKFDEAAPLLRESLEGHRRHWGDDHERTLVAITSQATLRQDQGNFAAAEQLAREVLKSSRRRYGDDNESTIMALNNLGYSLRKQGKLDEAEPLVIQALQCARRVLPANHRGTIRAIENRGAIFNDRGKYAEAKPYFREALDMCRTVLGDEDPYTLDLINDMGGLLMEQGMFDEAELLAREALETRRRTLGEKHPDSLMSLSNLGVFLRRAGKLDEAEHISRDALQRTRRVRGENHNDTLYAATNMGTLYMAQDRLDRAEPLFADVLDRCQRRLPPNHPLTPTAWFNLADLRQSQDRFQEADELYRCALELRLTLLGEAHPETLYVLHSQAHLRLTQGRADEALPKLRHVLAGYRRAFGDDHWQVGAARLHLARALADLGQYAAAAAELEAANRIFAAAQGPMEQRKQRVGEAFVELYEAWDAAEPGRGYASTADQWRARWPAASPKQVSDVDGSK